MPSTKARLEILDPTTFPIAKSGASFRVEFKLTKSSGAEVLKATIVRPTISGLILNLSANREDPVTSTSPPKMSVPNPIPKKALN